MVITIMMEEFTSATSMVPDSKVHDQHGAHLDPAGPRWAPYWPHEPCYQGCNGLLQIHSGRCAARDWRRDLSAMWQISPNIWTRKSSVLPVPRTVFFLVDLTQTANMWLSIVIWWRQCSQANPAQTTVGLSINKAGKVKMCQRVTWCLIHK